MRGKTDGKNEVYKPSNIEGKFHTPYIDINMSEFTRLESGKFTELVEDRLKDLNQKINGLRQERDDVISNAISDITTIEQKISALNNISKKDSKSLDTALILASENRITDIKKKARNKICVINKEAIAHLGEANELKKNFDADFNEELSFSREKLAIYWDSLFAKCKRINPATDVNAHLATESELLTMYSIRNPSLDFVLESYEVVSLEEFEETNGDTSKTPSVLKMALDKSA